jgi:hypothetical protein
MEGSMGGVAALAGVSPRSATVAAALGDSLQPFAQQEKFDSPRLCLAQGALLCSNSLWVNNFSVEQSVRSGEYVLR